MAAATFASSAPCSGQERDGDRAALAGDDPIRIAAAARHAARNARHDLVDDLVAAVERIPARSGAVDDEKNPDSHLPIVIFDALVELQAKPSPELLAAWWKRRAQYELLRGPLLALIARDPGPNAELLSDALAHWDSVDLVLGTIAADHFRRSDPRRLVAALIDRPLVEERVRVIDSARRTLEGGGNALYRFHWPKEFPQRVEYDFKFEAQPGYVPLLSGAVPLFLRRELSDQLAQCHYLEAEHDSKAGEIVSWRDAALANLRSIANLDVAAGLPRARTTLVLTWTDEAALREVVAARRRRIDDEWSALLAGLVAAKALDAADVARHPVRTRVKILDWRGNHEPKLPDIDSD